MTNARHRALDAHPLRDAVARPVALTTGSLAVVAVAAGAVAAPASANLPVGIGTKPAPVGTSASPPPAAPGTEQYTVARGDSVSKIAQRTGRTTSAVLAANGLRASDLIFPGQVLTLPPPGVASIPRQTPSAAASGSAEAVLASARSVIGTPYRWAEETPERGFDCSGLTFWAYGQNGVKLPRTTGALRSVGTRVSASEARPGDLVLFDDYAHVAIYLGDGRILDAPRKGTTVSERKLWTSRVVFRRVL